MGKNVGYARRRGYMYAVVRDSRGRFARFSRSRGEGRVFEAVSILHCQGGS